MLRRSFGAILVVLLFCEGCGSKAPQDRAPTSGSRNPYITRRREVSAEQGTTAALEAATLQINGDLITVEDVLDPVMTRIKDKAATSTPEALRVHIIELVKGELIGQVQELLIYQEAAKELNDQMFEMLDQRVDQEIRNRVNNEFGGRQTRFEQHLASMNMTMDDARYRERRRLLVRHHLGSTIVPKVANPTRQELLDYYHENIDEYSTPASRELYLIDIPKAGEVDAAARAAEALARLKDGQPFDDVAEEYSQGIHAADGGAWGAITSELSGRYTKVSEVFFKLKENHISRIVETDDAFFIVKAGQVNRGATKDFQSVQPELVQRYRSRQFEVERVEMVRALYDKAVIEPREEDFLRDVVAAATRRIAAIDGMARP